MNSLTAGIYTITSATEGKSPIGRSPNEESSTLPKPVIALSAQDLWSPLKPVRFCSLATPFFSIYWSFTWHFEYINDMRYRIFSGWSLQPAQAHTCSGLIVPQQHISIRSCSQYRKMTTGTPPLHGRSRPFHKATKKMRTCELSYLTSPVPCRIGSDAFIQYHNNGYLGWMGRRWKTASISGEFLSIDERNVLCGL
jgi:hypothetical protein